MNHLEVNWLWAGIGLAFLGIALTVFITCAVLDRYMGRREDRQWQQAFTRDMKHATAAPWDGETHEWTPETMAFLADQAGKYQADPLGYPADLGYGPDLGDWNCAEDAVYDTPVPASDISGPLPVISEPMKFEPASDDDVSWMKAWTDAFLAQQGVELP